MRRWPSGYLADVICAGNGSHLATCDDQATNFAGLIDFLHHLPH